MNIYFIQAFEAVDYDSYDSYVVIADSERRARELGPKGDESYTFDFRPDREGPWRKEVPFWTDPERSGCVKIGTAYEGACEQVVVASFNAG